MRAATGQNVRAWVPAAQKRPRDDKAAGATQTQTQREGARPAQTQMQRGTAVCVEKLGQGGEAPSAAGKRDGVDAKANADQQRGACAVCLQAITDRQRQLTSRKMPPVLTLSPCGHQYHGRCVYRWLKARRTCPVCRAAVQGLRPRMPLPELVLQKTLDEDDTALAAAIAHYDSVCCELCMDGGREHELVLCDGCDRGWHISCMNPPRATVPEGVWFCDACEPAGSPPERPAARRRRRRVS